MIHKETVLRAMDNSGANKVYCFETYSSGKYATIGDTIKVSIRTAIPNGKVSKGEKYKAVIVRTRAAVKRKHGDDIRFEENCVVLVDDKGLPIGTRVTGTVPREVAQKIRSLATGVC